MNTTSPPLVSVSGKMTRQEMETRMNQIRAEFAALNRRYAHRRYKIYPPIEVKPPAGPHPLDVLIGKAKKPE